MSGQFCVINPFKIWKKGDLPCDPHVILALSQWGTKDNIIIIPGTHASDSEVDFAIDRLKNDLETVRKEAKRILKSQRDKMKSTEDSHHVTP